MIGLVLEGGAMRGMYTAGVLDIFMEQQVKVDGIVGTSAGALFGVNYVSEQKGRVIRYNKKYNGNKEYMGILPLLKERNIVSTELAYKKVPREWDPFDDETYQKNGTPFYAVITNVYNGKPEYVLIKSVFEQMDVLRASGSMPFVSTPVEFGGNKYLDGSIADSIPFEWLSKQGYDKIVVVLTRDAAYRKEAMSKAATAMYKIKYPDFAKTMEKRHENYNQSIEKLCQWEKEGKAFVIRPSRPITIPRMESNPQKLQEVYDQGIADTMAKLEALREYIQ